MLHKRVIILGSTGSIGTQTLEVIRHVNSLAANTPKSDPRGALDAVRFEVVGLAAGKNAALLAEQAREFGVRHVALAEHAGAAPAGHELPTGCRVLRGATSAEELVRSVGCDVVVAAMVGIAGLPATLAAVDAGRTIALANKETLVAAGALVVPRILEQRARLRAHQSADQCAMHADESNSLRTHDASGAASLLPVDSEHAALFQCLGACVRGAPPFGACPAQLGRATLTASGGPFREWTLDQLARATPEEALRHPTWNMGRKVTIDSATLMNKALELIEAHWLFGVPPDKLGAILHPQSLVHAIAEFVDGSCVAQLGAPDMKTPIQRALCWPVCVQGCSRRMDWAALRALTFEPVESARFPAVSLAHLAMQRGGTSGATLNGANEAAVEAFLGGETGFLDITRLVQAALSDLPTCAVRTLQDVLDADGAAREFVRARIGKSVR